MKDLTLPTPDLQAVRDETIASGQHKDLIRACSLAGLSYADCMRIVAYMPALSHHEDGGRAATSELEQMRERKDAAYLERNQVVAALAKCFPSGVARTAIEGWSEDWHGCVYIDLPTGQASWHFHDSHAYLFDSLPPYTGTWDGHDTPEKYARLAKLGVALGGEKGEAVAWRFRWHPEGDWHLTEKEPRGGDGTTKQPLFAAPVGKARMLTDEEADHITGMHNTGRSQGDSECAEAIQRKFCEVNGITLEGGNRSRG